METKVKETLLAKAEVEASLELLQEQYKAIKEQKDREDRQNSET